MRLIVTFTALALTTAACSGQSPTSPSANAGIASGGAVAFDTRAIGDDQPSKPPVPGSPRLSNEQCTPSPVVVPGSVGSVLSVVGYRVHMSVWANPHADTYMGEARISRRLQNGTWTAPVAYRSRDFFTRPKGSDTAVYEVEVAVQDYDQRIDQRTRVIFTDCQSNWSDWTTVIVGKGPNTPQQPTPVPPVVPPVVPVCVPNPNHDGLCAQ